MGMSILQVGGVPSFLRIVQVDLIAFYFIFRSSNLDFQHENIGNPEKYFTR